MPKYICELSRLTRSTALVVVESDDDPTRGDLREVYYEYDDEYDDAEWNEDPEYAEEGQHGVLGFADGDFPGVSLDALPVFVIDADGDVTRKES